MRGPILLAVIFLFMIVVGAFSIDEGEVATLITTDDRGRAMRTGVWVVEPDGTLYLRASSPRADWLERLSERPEVALDRGGVVRSYRAVRVDDPVIRDRVNRAMAAKYGRLDHIVSLLRRRDRSVPVRLDPLAVSTPGAALP